MKSNILSNFDLTRSKDFGDDFNVLVGLAQDTLSGLASNMAEIYLTPSNLEESNLVTSLANDLKIDRVVLDNVVDVGKFFLSTFLEADLTEDDTPANIADDLNELKLISRENIKKVEIFLSTLKSSASDLKTTQRRLDYTKSYLPLVQNIDLAIDQRCVFEKKYKFTENPEDYKPRCTEVVPMVIAKLKISGEHRDACIFQMDRRGLQLLINHLTVAMSQLDAAEKYLNLK